MMVRSVACWMVTVGLCLAAWVPAAAQTRSEAHEKYAAALWKSLHPSKPGFETRLREGRVWVFRPGSAELAEFEKCGDLAKHVTRPGAGPQGMTVKAADAETLDAYLRVAVAGQPSDG